MRDTGYKRCAYKDRYTTPSFLTMAGSSEANIVEKATHGALEELQQREPDEYQRLIASDPEKKKELIAATKEVAEETMKLTWHIDIHIHIHIHFTSADVESCLGMHLDPARVEMLKKALTIPTYEMRLNMREDGHWADITRDGDEFMPSVKLDTFAAIDRASYIQMASIIVEAVLLVMSANGIRVKVNNKVLARTTNGVVPAVQKSGALQKVVQQLKEAFASGSTYNRAKAIFNVIKVSNSVGILWQIIKGLCSNMNAWDWMKTSAMVSTMIIAALATDGVALIAEIVLALHSAHTFARKVTNLIQLDAMKD